MLPTGIGVELADEVSVHGEGGAGSVRIRTDQAGVSGRFRIVFVHCLFLDKCINLGVRILS